MQILGTDIFTTHDIARIAHAPHTQAPIVIRSVCMNSKEVRSGSLFIPIKGNRTDGHFFIKDAIAAGAVAVLLDKQYENNEEMNAVLHNFSGFFCYCADVLSTFTECARWYAQHFSPICIGITGSNGKTTAKEMLTSILRVAYGEKAVYHSYGNYNSILGLPMVLFGLSYTHKYAVYEMAMSHPHEMKQLAELIRPHIGLITNIGTAHIGNVGSKRAIAHEKAQLFAYMGVDNVGFIPEHIAFYDEFKTSIGDGTLYTYQTGVSEPLQWHNRTISLSVFGTYNNDNARGVATVAHYLGVSSQHIADGLEQYTPLFGRGQIIHAQTYPCRIIVDCYNANLDSMRASIAMFQQLQTTRRKILFLGDMKELGKQSAKNHRALAHEIVQSAISYVVLYGDEIRETYRVLQDVHDTIQVFYSNEMQRICSVLQDLARTPSYMLVKSSRAMKLEDLISASIAPELHNIAMQ